jgi:hypothetical protein
MTDRRSSFLLWFGLAAAPLAWALELVVGYGFEDVACSRGSMDWGVNDLLWQALTFLVALGIGGAGLAASLASVRAVRAGAGDPRGRAWLLAHAAFGASALFVLLTATTGIGVLVLEPCHG